MPTSYRVVRKIGEGGMGEVFLAVQEPLGRQVALKFLFEEFSSSTQIERFEREIEAALRIRHPAVIEILDKGSQDDRRYYAMEFLDGWLTLHDAIREKGAFPWPRAAAVIAQVLDALTFCHDAQLIHRDIKPRNIMIDANERAKLMDFGLVKDLDRTVLTAPGKILGTPSYIAPEVFKGDEVTASADIFSVGVVLYEMVTGRRAFQGPDMPTIAMEILESSPPALGQFGTDLVPYQDLMDRFLEKDPARRFATAREALEAMRETTPSAVGIGRGPRAARPVRTTTTMKRQSPASLAPGSAGPLSDTLVPGPGRARRLRRILAGLGGTGALAVLLAAGTFALRSAPPSPPPPAVPAADLVDLRVDAGADRLRFSVRAPPPAGIGIHVTQVTGGAAVSRAKATLTTSTWIQGLEAGKEYHYRLTRPDGGILAENDVRTLTLPFVGARLVRALESGDVMGTSRRIRDLIIKNAGLRSSVDMAVHPDNLHAVRAATERAALIEGLDFFRPVQDAFYGSPDVPWDLKRDVNLQLLALTDLEDLAEIRGIPVKRRTRGMTSAAWSLTASSAIDPARARSLIIAWSEVPDPAALGIGEVVQVVPTGQKAGRWFSFSRGSFGESYFKEFESEGDRVTTIAFQTREALDLDFVKDATKLELVTEISAASPRNWLTFSIGPENSEPKELAHVGSLEQVDHRTRTYHALDPRAIPPGRHEIRVETHYDEDSPGWKQQFVDIHWIAIRVELPARPGGH